MTMLKLRLPPSFRQPIPGPQILQKMRALSSLGVNTVCKESKCPNFCECLSADKLTFMILGDTCTRNCGFCNVTKALAKEQLPVDPQEPERIAGLAKEMKLKYAVITSVTRDDLIDGGAEYFAKTIFTLRRQVPGIKIEVLIPDFSGNLNSLRTVISAKPDVLAHNLETVERLYPEVRPRAGYDLSLRLLKKAKEAGALITKSSLMLGLGETKGEVITSMRDLKNHGCDALTLGQYLAPSGSHYPVREFINIELFNEYQKIGINLGFKAVFSGPKVRSSYQAENLYSEVTEPPINYERIG